MVRKSGRGQVGAGRVSQVVSGYAACAAVPRPHVRWLGEPSPRRSDRLSPGGESGPPRTPGPSAASPDGRPASSTRCARSQTRPAGLDAGRGHRHPGYDPALVPETDRQEIRWQRPPTSRSTHDPTRRRRARGQDGGRQSAVGLHADPRRALKPRPHYRPDHGEADPARPRSRPGARAEPAHALEDVPAGALGGPGGLRSVHRRGVDAGGAQAVPRLLRDRAEIPPRDHRRDPPAAGRRVDGAAGPQCDRPGRWLFAQGAPSDSRPRSPLYAGLWRDPGERRCSADSAAAEESQSQRLCRAVRQVDQKRSVSHAWSRSARGICVVSSTST